MLSGKDPTPQTTWLLRPIRPHKQPTQLSHNLPDQRPLQLTIMSVGPIISVLATSLLKRPVAAAAKGLARISKMSVQRVSKSLQTLRWAGGLGALPGGFGACQAVLGAGGGPTTAGHPPISQPTGTRQGAGPLPPSAARSPSAGVSPILRPPSPAACCSNRGSSGEVDFATVLKAHPELMAAAKVTPAQLERLGGRCGLASLRGRSAEQASKQASKQASRQASKQSSTFKCSASLADIRPRPNSPIPACRPPPMQAIREQSTVGAAGGSVTGAAGGGSVAGGKA